MDNIEVDFTEEEKKSWDNSQEKKPSSEQVNKESKIFFLNYDKEQRIVFFSLLILLFLIGIFTALTKDNTEIVQNNPNKPNNPSPKLAQKLILEKGEEAPIVDKNNNGLKSIFVGVGWTPASETEIRMDVDSTVILVDSVRKDAEEICYYNLRGPGVTHHGDNLTGENTQTQVNSMSLDDENIDVYLSEIPKKYDKIYFVLNIFDANERGQSLSIVRNMYINIYDLNKNLLMQYLVNENTFGNALVLGVAEVDRVEEEKQLTTNDKYVPVWTFKAIGTPLNVKDINDLCHYCKYLNG